MLYRVRRFLLLCLRSPFQTLIDCQCASKGIARGRDRHTFCGIDGHGVGGLVSFLVLGDHHLDIQLFQPLLGYGDTDVPAITNIPHNARLGVSCPYAFAIAIAIDSGEETDLVCRIKKAIFSVVISLAAIHRSPSFSLLSSSITTTNSPLPNASRASSIGSN